jgi:hypothetical protein
MTLTDLPIWFVPSIPLLGVGLFITPILCLLLLIFIIVRFSRVRPRPYSLIIFLASVGLAVIVTGGTLMWNYSLHSLIFMCCSGVLVLAEVLARKLPRHFGSAVSALVICCGYYFFLLSAVSSASV